MPAPIRLGVLYVDTEVKTGKFASDVKALTTLLRRANKEALQLARTANKAFGRAQRLRGLRGLVTTLNKVQSQSFKAEKAQLKLAKTHEELRAKAARAAKAEADLAIKQKRLEAQSAKTALAVEKSARGMERLSKIGAGAGLASILSDTRRIVLVTGALIFGITQFGDKAYAELTQYQDAMAGAVAVTEATQNEIAALEGTALKFGRTTIFSATESAQALYLLGQAGFRTHETIATLGGSLRLAAAAGVEVSQATELVVSVLNQFRIPVSLTDQVADIISATEAFTLATLPKLQTSLRYVGATAGQLKVPFDQTATAIGALTNAGFEASMAGTQLRMALMRLAGGGSLGNVQKGLDRMGISLADVQERLSDFPALIELFEEGAKRMGSEVEVTSAIFQIFGVRAGPGFLQLLNLGSEGFRELNKRITQAGVAERIAAIRTDTLSFSVKQLWNVMKNLEITFSKSSGVTMRKVVDGLTNILRKIDESDQGTKDLIGTVTSFAGALAVATLGMGAFFVVAADGIMVLQQFQKALLAMNIGLAASPLALFAIMLGTATAALLAFGAALAAARDKQAETFKEFSKAWWEYQQFQNRVPAIIARLRAIRAEYALAAEGSKEAQDLQRQFNDTLQELATIVPDVIPFIDGINTNIDKLAAVAERAAKALKKILDLKTWLITRSKKAELARLKSELAKLERYKFGHVPKEVALTMKTEPVARLRYLRKQIGVLKDEIDVLEGKSTAAAESTGELTEQQKKQLQGLLEFRAKDLEAVKVLGEAEQGELQKMLRARKLLADAEDDVYGGRRIQARIDYIENLNDQRIDAEKIYLSTVKRINQDERDEALKKEEAFQRELLAIKQRWTGQELKSRLAKIDQQYEADRARMQELVALGKATQADLDALEQAHTEKHNSEKAKDEERLQRSLSSLIRTWGRRDLDAQLQNLEDRKNAAIAMLDKLGIAEEDHARLKLLIEQGYQEERDRLTRQANDRLAKEWEQQYRDLLDLMRAALGPVETVFAGIMRETNAAKYQIKDFFSDLRDEIAQFLASEAAHDLLNWFKNMLTGGSGGWGFWGIILGLAAKLGLGAATGGPGAAAAPGWGLAMQPAPQRAAEAASMARFFAGHMGPQPAPVSVESAPAVTVNLSNTMHYSGPADKQTISRMLREATEDVVEKALVPQLRRLSRSGVTILHQEGIAPGRKKR